MCEHLLKAGHSVVVYNRSPARLASLLEIGAVAASSPKDVRCFAWKFVHCNTQHVIPLYRSHSAVILCFLSSDIHLM
jgi:hypothetical protein